MPEPTTELQLRRRTVKMHTRSAVVGLRTAARALRDAPEAKGSPLLKHLESALLEAQKAEKIADLWGAAEPSLFDGSGS